MQNHVKYLVVFLTVAAFISLLTPDHGTSSQRNLTGFECPVFSGPFDDASEAALRSVGENPVNRGTTRPFAANTDANGTNGDKKGNDGELEEEDDGGDSGFDRLWDVTLCG